MAVVVENHQKMMWSHLTTKQFSFVDKDIAECNSVGAQDESDEDDELCMMQHSVEESEAKHLATRRQTIEMIKVASAFRQMIQLLFSSFWIVC